MEGSVEESFPDVVRFIDSNYRTVAKKKGRAMAGSSTGALIRCVSPESIRIRLTVSDCFPPPSSLRQM